MSDTLCRFIPSRLTEARQARGLNMSQLAEKVDISRQAVSKYEQGLIVPTDRILRAISSSLDFPIDFFINHSLLIALQKVLFFIGV